MTNLHPSQLFTVSISQPYKQTTHNHMIRGFFLWILMSLSFLSLGQGLPFEYQKEQPNSPTVNKDATIWLNLSKEGLNEIQSLTEPLVSWTVLLPNEGAIKLTLLESCPFQQYIPIGERIDDGAGGVKVTERFFTTDLKTFDITGSGIGGSLVIFKDHIIGSIRYNNRVFELRPVDLKTSTSKYVLFDVNNSRGESHFSCAADDIVKGNTTKPTTHAPSNNKSLILDCIEIGIDIDQFTFNTFPNCDASINWALAVLAGVDEIYRTNLNNLVTLQASYINIWQTPDPYAGTVNNAGVMLDQLRSTWITDPILSTANHDVVHLMSKRTDTGTGGIAWVDAVCSTWGVAFSSYMDNNTGYTLPSYNWNLNVVGHELGHNFGSNHTHWCGWPGGPIDNCGTLEGPCGGYVDNPTAQVGTMMSYCHAITGGSISLQFHNTVKTVALIPTLTANGSCHGVCVGTSTSCGSYGCMDPTACNYDPTATVDDGSCGVVDVCGICAGGGVSCSGCTDPIACNYNAAVSFDDGSCVYAPPGFGCNCTSQAALTATLTATQSSSVTFDGSGSLTTADFSLIYTNSTGGSSWPGDLLVEIIAPSGQCISIGGYDVTSACAAGSDIWPSAWNITASGTYIATYDFSTSGLAGSGLWTMQLTNGWTSSASVNYNMTATFGGICSGPPAVTGCTDVNACNFNPLATLDDGSCEFTSCAGCTNIVACNYNPSATIDDGSCEMISCAGCMDPTACNYDPTATLNNSSCDFLSCAGCTDATACNYVPTATIDDGTCEYLSCNCPADIDGDGFVTVNDVLIMLGEFNCLTGCTADVDGNGSVTVADLLAILAAFGSAC